MRDAHDSAIMATADLVLLSNELLRAISNN
jgi:hypothetical protein